MEEHMEENQSATIIKQDVLAYVDQRPIVVTTREECETTQVDVIEGRKEIKRKEEVFNEKIMAKTKESYDKAKEDYDSKKALLKEILEPLVAWEAEANKKICAFIAEERRLERLKQEKERKAFEIRIAKAEKKGQDIADVKPMDLVKSEKKTMKTSDGQHIIRITQDLVILDEKKIPELYFKRELDKKALKAALEGGAVVPGAILQESVGTAVKA